MFYPQDNSNGEVKRDQLLHSSLAYWSAGPRGPAQPGQLTWEAGSPVPPREGARVWLVLAILIGLSAMLIVAI